MGAVPPRCRGCASRESQGARWLWSLAEPTWVRNHTAFPQGSRARLCDRSLGSRAGGPAVPACLPTALHLQLPSPGLCKAARAAGVPALLFSRSCLGSRTQVSPLPGSLPLVLSGHPPAPVQASGITLLCAHLLPSPGRGLSQFRPPTPGPPRTQAGTRHEEQHPPGSQEHPRMKGSHRGEQAIMQTQGTNR